MIRAWAALLAAILSAGCASLPYGLRDKRAEPGFQYMERGDWDGAIANFSNAIAETPDRYGLYALRAKSFYNKGQIAAAISDWSKAVELAQAHGGQGILPVLYADRGAAYYTIGRCDEAVIDLNKSLAARDLPGDRAVRGACLEILGQFEQALADFDRALAIAPAQRMALGGRVECLLALKRYPEALETVTRYLALHPEDGRFLFMQGVAFVQTGQAEKARAIAQRAFATNEYSEHVWGGHELEMFQLDERRATVKKALERGRELAAAGKWEEAFETLTTGWDRNLALTMQDRADAELLRREILKAYPHLKQKPTLPEYARRYQVEAESYAKDVGDLSAPNKALGSYQLLEAVVPWYPPAYYDAAILRGRLGDYEGAIRDMREYLQLVGSSKETRDAQDKIYEWEARNQPISRP